MNEFLFYSKLGLYHILDWNALDHLLFLVVLCLPYASKQWRNLIWLITLFTLGHTTTLGLATYNIIKVDVKIIEFLIPVTILIVALFNVFTAGKGAQKEKIGVLFFSTLFFGLIHGLGFAREFHMLAGKSDNKFFLLIEFALGIEISQVIIVFTVLFLGFLAQTLFRLSKRDWIMVISAIVVGLVIPMILNSDFLS